MTKRADVKKAKIDALKKLLYSDECLSDKDYLQKLYEARHYTILQYNIVMLEGHNIAFAGPLMSNLEKAHYLLEAAAPKGDQKQEQHIIGYEFELPESRVVN